MANDPLSPNRMAVDMQGVHDLRAQMKADPKLGLKKAAQEFESMFLQMVLKSMRDTVPQDGLMSSEETRFFTSMLDQQMAQDLAKGGSLGFAKMLEQQFRRNLAAPMSADVLENVKPNFSPAAQGLLNNLEALKSAVPGNLPVNIPQAPVSPLSQPQVSVMQPRVESINAVDDRQRARTDAAATPQDFVSKVWPHALEASRVTGIPPQFLVAQAALETGWGKQEIRRADGLPSYNLFGIKAGRQWDGQIVSAQTQEFIQGQPVQVTASFRAYNSYAESFQDYANLLRSNPRYGSVIGSQDGTEFARRLQQAGYATDPQYAEKLARIISGPTMRQAMIG